MNRLPVEVAIIILDELYPIHDPDEIPKIPLANLKAMRLSCRLFAELAGNYLFHCVWLYIDEDSFVKLTALSEHPTLRHKVETLKVFSKLLSADLLRKKDYETCVKAITTTVKGREAWGFDVDGNRTLTQEQLDAGFAEYHHHHNSQVDFQCKTEDLLQAALTAFTNLSWISNGFLIEILDSNDKVPSQQSRVSDIACKTLPARNCRGWKSDVHDVDDALMLIRAIARSDCDCLTLDLGTLYGSYDYLFLEFSPQNRGFAKQALQKVLRLGISLLSTNDKKFEQMLNAGRLSQFLSWGTMLETLVVTNAGIDFIVTLPQVFGTGNWNNLRSLSPSGFVVAFVDLSNLFELFSETLQSLSIECITLCTGSWYRGFIAIRDMQKKGALKKFHPQHLDHTNSGE